jgi:5-methylcytosine-specific restriction endonuclease McrA
LPLSPERFELRLTGGRALRDNLEQLKHLLRHQNPRGDLAVIVERAVELLLAKTLKQRFAQTTARTSIRQVGSACRGAAGVTGESHEVGVPLASGNRRYVPRAVLREVFARDGGQCTFVTADGRRCAERGMLEVHHVRAFAHGGRATVGNLKLVCRVHNGLFAERDFGDEFMRFKSGVGQTSMTCCPSNS